jgi:hypothetical protein
MAVWTRRLIIVKNKYELSHVTRWSSMQAGMRGSQDSGGDQEYLSGALQITGGEGGFEPQVQLLTVQRFSNSLFRCHATQSQVLRVALPHQKSPHVISFGSFGTVEKRILGA